MTQDNEIIETSEIDEDEVMCFNRHEIERMYDYFMNRAGYISHEFDFDLVRKIIPNMSRFLNK